MPKSKKTIHKHQGKHIVTLGRLQESREAASIGKQRRMKKHRAGNPQAND